MRYYRINLPRTYQNILHEHINKALDNVIQLCVIATKCASID